MARQITGPGSPHQPSRAAAGGTAARSNRLSKLGGAVAGERAHFDRPLTRLWEVTGCAHSWLSPERAAVTARRANTCSRGSRSCHPARQYMVDQVRRLQQAILGHRGRKRDRWTASVSC
jgi:hypothetical protein